MFSIDDDELPLFIGKTYHVKTKLKSISSLPLFSILGTPPRWLVFKVPGKELTSENLNGDKEITRLDEIIELIETPEVWTTMMKTVTIKEPISWRDVQEHMKSFCDCYRVNVVNEDDETRTINFQEMDYAVLDFAMPRDRGTFYFSVAIQTHDSRQIVFFTSEAIDDMNENDFHNYIIWSFVKVRVL